jgi:uncharacterized Zn-binding protein involved in type VI secretion
MVTPGGVPHEGGKIIAGCQTVWIDGAPAATVGDVCLCNGGFLDVITSGSSGVFIEGKPAVRQGDLCSHGGMITSGSATVLIGETMNPDLIRALNEAKNKSGFKEPSEEEKIVLINQAIQDCIALLERKLMLLERGDSETLDSFKTWFGRSDYEAKQRILTRIERALEVSRTLTVDNFGVIDYEKDRKEDYAKVYRIDILNRIFLGDPFWAADIGGRRSKAGILIHELSHFKTIGNTEDHAYADDCLNLAKDNPADALYNADSFEFFIDS